MCFDATKGKIVLIYPEWWEKAENRLNANVADFAVRIKSKLETLKPEELIRRKNPYLFCLRATNKTDGFAASVLDAFLSSSEETMFGTLAEQCAVVICQSAKNGMKSTAEGIDIEYVENETRTIIQVKSGKNWGNSSQRKNCLTTSIKPLVILQQGNNVHVRCIEGVCYGPASNRSRGSYYTYIGSDFWEEVSGWEDTHIALLSIFVAHAQNGLMESKTLAKGAVTQFLIESGISQQGEIDWVNWVNYVDKKRSKK